MQIFLDVSGRRHTVVNRILSVGAIMFFVFITFITIYTVRLQLIARSSQFQSPQQLPVQNTPVTMMYTDNHKEAYPILREQIESIDRLITPTYLVTDSGVTYPANYKKLHEDIEFLKEMKSADYKSFHHLSTKDYNNLPLDRSTDSSALIMYPEILDTRELNIIRDSLVAAGASGLIIELDAQIIEDEAITSRMVEWLELLQKSLHEKELELGIHLSLSAIDENASELLRGSDLVYLSFSQTNALDSQLQSLSSVKDQLPENTVIEIPTVSSKVNMLNQYDYVKNVDYSSVVSLVEKKSFEDRTVEHLKIINGNSRYQVFDAVSAFNIMESARRQASFDNLQFSVGSPGYEEYTLWSLLLSSTQQAGQQEILTTKVMNNRGVEHVGQGEIYKLDQAGTFGSRSIKFNNQSQMITSSFMKDSSQPAVINRSGHKPSTVALTFDDGPHPKYTSKIMDVLEEYGIKGTFFVVGEKVLNHPDVARDIVRRGHEIENHTYTHAAISQVNRETAVAEIMATSDIIEFITGQSAQYFRRPYSDSRSVNSQADVAYLQLLDDLGLQASEYDIDSKDWELTSVDAIFQKVKNDIAELPEGSFTQVLLHDSHDNPELTVAALPSIIEYFQDDDISLVRVDELANTPSNGAKDTPAFLALSLKDNFVRGFVLLNIVLIGFAITKYLWMVGGSIAYFIHKWKLRRVQRPRRLKLLLRPTLVVIVACYNEERVIGKTIQSLLNSSYKKFRIIIVNDGSTDSTSKVIEQYKTLDPRVELITQQNQGKAQALQHGIAHVRNKWLVFCDADTIFATDALEKYIYAVNSKNNLGAVAGRIRVGNDINLLTRAQVIEYGVSHTFIKPAQDMLKIITVVPGACGLWNRKNLIAAGGFSSDTLAEDADATLNIVSMRKRVSYEDRIMADTEAPHNISSLYKQRTRWQLGNMQALFKHHKGVFNSQYGALGYVGLPMFYIEILHVLFFPLLLLFAIGNLLIKLFQLGSILPTDVSFVSSQALLGLSLGIIVFDVLLSIVAIVREKKRLKQKIQLFSALPYYYLFYRFFLSYSTLIALLRGLRGRLHGWGHLNRSATVKLPPVLTSQQ